MGFWDRYDRWINGGKPSVPEMREAESIPTTAPGSIPSPPARSGASVVVSPNDALGLASVYRAVEIRVSAISQLSIDIKRGAEDVERPLWLRRPDVGTSWRVFLEQTVTSLNLQGNAYWRVRRDSSKAVRSLEVLNPLDVTIRQSDSGRVVGYSHKGHDLDLEDVQHLSRLRVPGSPYGLGPIQSARNDLRGALDLQRYSSSWFSAGDVPTGILSTDQHLDTEDAQSAKNAFLESQANGRTLAVLGKGITYSPILLNPADAQFLESRQYSVTEIARLFGVPASLMLASVEGSSMTYSNVTSEWLGFIRFNLISDYGVIEDAISELLPRGQVAKFNLEALLRQDTEGRYAAHAAGINAGWLLPSEVREIEDLPPVAGIDDKPRPAAPAIKETK